MTDARPLFAWRSDPTTRSASRITTPLTWDEHIAWLTRVLADPDRILLVAEDDGVAVGTVRLDHRTDVDWEISITVAPAARGRGLALPIVDAARTQPISARCPRRLLARVHRDDARSLRLIESAGYLPHLPEDARGFVTFAGLVLPIEGTSSTMDDLEGPSNG